MIPGGPDPADHSAAFRPDIEGLRAVAVLAVVLYHASLGPFRGGYVGVDVFFVVSGYLITGVLRRSFAAGPGALRAFWARRARRLLPAAAMVVVTTIVVGRAVLDPLAQRSLGHDAIATALFFVNVVFARRESDYFASQLAPSPLLHFWSLSVEEQFYVVWPLLLLAARSLRRHRTAVTASVLAMLWVASFTSSVVLTRHHTSLAFYLLPTRAWELLTGAGAALVAPRVIGKMRAGWRAALGWLGAAMVCAAAVLFGGRTDFPGWVALFPVAGTLAIILAGIVPAKRGAHRLLGERPLVWIGRRSYGIYLWHWPALVLIAAAAGSLAWWGRVAVLCVSVVLAALTYRIIENPVRQSPWLARRARRGLLLGGCLASCSVGLAWLSLTLPQRLDSGRVAAPVAIVVPVHEASASSLDPSTSTTLDPADTSGSTDPITAPSVGSAAPVPASTAQPVSNSLDAMVAANQATLAQSTLTNDVPANLVPRLALAGRDKPSIYRDGCMLSDGQSTPPTCVYGDPAATTDIVLFGDSHAAQWFPALQQIVTAHGWRLEVLTKKGCPTADIRIAKRVLDGECIRWRSAVASRLAAEHPTLIVMSAFRYSAGGAAVHIDPDVAWGTGLDTTLSALRPTAAHVLVLGDTPTPSGNAPACVSAHIRSVSGCVAPRSRAVKPGRLAVEQDEADRHDASFIATSDWLCTPTSCPVIIGNVLVYRDNNHLTTAAALLLAPYLESAVTAALGNST